MKKIAILISICCFTFLLNAQEKQYKVAAFGFYNVENLYDTIDQANDDAEFLPNGKNHWNSEKYFTKIDHISDVISQIGSELTNRPPVAMGLCEVENREVLVDLVNSAKLKPYNYEIVHYNSPDKRGVDVAFIYQKNLYTVTNSKSISLKIENNKDFATRDQLVVSGIFDGEPLHFIINHWPSRRGGEKRSAALRNAAASLCKKSVDSLLALDKNAKIIIMGDLNDDPVNKSVSQFLNAKKSITETTPSDLFNTSYSLYKDGIGSLAYRDSWNLFDQMIISAPLLGEDKSTYKYIKTKVFNKPFLAQKEGSFAGYPWRTYVGNEYKGGYSDHFPVYLFLGKEK